MNRTLNAFLNSNVEATVYLGITDAGIVKGIPFSVDQVSMAVQLSVISTLFRSEG